MNASRIELLWLVWDQSRSKYYFGFGWLYRDIFYISQYFWQMTVHISFQVYFFSINYQQSKKNINFYESWTNPKYNELLI